MANDKQQDKHITGPTIKQEIERCSKLKKHEYASTQYDASGKLLDDNITQEDESLYWESFVCRKQAVELARRLAVVEADDYEEGQQVFEEMEDDSD